MLKIAIQIAEAMKSEGFGPSEIITELKRQGLPSGPVVRAVAKVCGLDHGSAKMLVYESPEYKAERKTVEELEKAFLGEDLKTEISLE